MDIKKRTIKRLRTAASKFFPDDDAYHIWLGSEYGYESTLELSEDEGREAIRKIDGMKKDKKRKQYPDRNAHAITFDQKEYIEGLFEECGIPDGKRRWGFIEKQIGAKKSVDWLSNREASKVITGLKRAKNSLKAEEG